MLRSSHGYLIEQCSPMVLSCTLIFHFSSAWLLCLLTDSEFRQGSTALLHTLTIYPSWTTPTLCSLLQTNSALTPGYPVWLSCSSSPDWSGRWGCAPIFLENGTYFLVCSRLMKILAYISYIDCIYPSSLHL